MASEAVGPGSIPGGTTTLQMQEKLREVFKVRPCVLGENLHTPSLHENPFVLMFMLVRRFSHQLADADDNQQHQRAR